MTQSMTSFLVHYGPLRAESQAILERTVLPTLLITSDKLDQAHYHLPTLKNIDTLLALKAGQANLHTYNLATFNSLTPATGLNTLYPGLQNKALQVVETQTLDEVIDAHFNLGTNFTQLVLEQFEESLILLSGWQEKGLLDDLEKLWIRTSATSLYETMDTQQEVIAWCKSQGFEQDEDAGLPTAEDPEILLACFKRNPLYVPLKNAQAEIKKTKIESENLNAKLSELKNEIETVNKENDALKKRRNELKKQLESMRELENIENERNCYAEQASERQQQIHEMQRQSQKLHRQNQHLQQQQLKFQNELAKAEAHVEMIKELMLNG